MGTFRKGTPASSTTWGHPARARRDRRAAYHRKGECALISVHRKVSDVERNAKRKSLCIVNNWLKEYPTRWHLQSDEPISQVIQLLSCRQHEAK